MRKLLVMSAALVLTAGAAAAQTADDPFAWLEDVQGDKALAWAKEHNAKTLAVLEARPEYKPIYARTLADPGLEGQDPDARALRRTSSTTSGRTTQHERGIWRRTTLASYRTAAPQWETVLDVDALAKADGKPWVFHGATVPGARLRALHGQPLAGRLGRVRRARVRHEDEGVRLRRLHAAGSQVLHRVARREHALARHGLRFRLADVVRISPDREALEARHAARPPPRPCSRARRRTSARRDRTEILSDGRYDLITRTPAFFREETFLYLGDRLVRLDLPEDARPRVFFRDRLLFSLRSDWTVGGKTYREGSLLAGTVDDLLGGAHRYDVLFEPSARVSLADVDRTRDRVLLQTLDNVRSRLTALSLKDDGSWSRAEIPTPGIGTADLTATSDQSESFFFTYEDFTTPKSLWLAENGRGARPGQVDAGVLRREGHDDRAVRGDVEGRHEDPVLRRAARRA